MMKGRTSPTAAMNVALCAFLFFSAAASQGGNSTGAGDASAITVNALNYVRAVTAIQFGKYYARAGGINRFSHQRAPVSVDNRSSKRLNRDTLYSIAIVDISKGAFLELPDAGDRYLSVQVVNEDGFTNRVIHGSGRHALTMEEFDTPFVWLLARTLVVRSDVPDMTAIHALQDEMRIVSQSAQPYSPALYDQESFATTTHLLSELGKGITSNAGAAGSREQVDPIKQLILSAYGFGTLPETESFLIVEEPNLPSDGAYRITVRDVPVDGFWSLTVYDKDGYFKRNSVESYGFSDQTATKNPDGSVTLHLGGDPNSINYLPITDGWNYVVRLYQPREAVLNGEWNFPSLESLPD